jgi:hypothetical protein
MFVDVEIMVNNEDSEENQNNEEDKGDEIVFLEEEEANDKSKKEFRTVAINANHISLIRSYGDHALLSIESDFFPTLAVAKKSREEVRDSINNQLNR